MAEARATHDSGLMTRIADTAQGMLCLVFIVAHVIRQFYIHHNVNDHLILTISVGYVFSGLIFFFGMRYVQRPHTPVTTRKLLSKSFDIYLASLIGGLVLIFLGDRSTNKNRIFDMILLQDVPALADVLLAWALMMLIVALIGRQLRTLVSYPLAAVAVTAVLLLLNLLPKVTLFPFNLILPNGNFAYPIGAALPSLILGMLMGSDQQRLTLTTALIFLVCGLLAPIYISYTIEITRFPPNITWLTLNIAQTAIIYYIAHAVIQLRLFDEFLVHVGRNSLFHLLFTTIFMFIIWSTRLVLTESYIDLALLALAVTAISLFMVERVVRTRSSAETYNSDRFMGFALAACVVWFGATQLDYLNSILFKRSSDFSPPMLNDWPVDIAPADWQPGPVTLDDAITLAANNFCRAKGFEKSTFWRKEMSPKRGATRFLTADSLETNFCADCNWVFSRINCTGTLPAPPAATETTPPATQ